MALTREEINRKLLHILSGTLIPGGIFYIPRIADTERYIPVIILFFLALISGGLEAARFRLPRLQKLFLKFGGSMLRKSEDKTLTGATYIFASSFLCSVIFYNRPDISLIVLSMFILGDAAAALTGLSIGRIRIGEKSLEGSTGFFLISMLLLMYVYPYLPEVLDNWNGRIPLTTAVSVSVFTVLLELFPLKFGRYFSLNDNLYVPVASGLLLKVLTPVTGT